MRRATLPGVSDESSHEPAGEPIASAPTPSGGEGRVLRRSDSDHHSTHPVQIVGAGAPVIVSGPRHARLAALARAQHGAMSRDQLRAAGLDGSAIARLVARGQIQRIHPGVYHLSSALPPLARETAALLACGDGALLSHATAAVLWELPVPRSDRIHVLVPGRQAGKPAGVTVHRSRTMAPTDLRHRHGLPLTSPARTLLDLADSLTGRTLERALDEALVKRVVRPAQLREVLARATGRRGASVLNELLSPERATARTRSDPEELFLELVRRSGLRPPEVNAELLGFEVDFLWRDERLAVEVDSYRYHSRPSKFERDRRQRHRPRQSRLSPFAAHLRSARGRAARPCGHHRRAAGSGLVPRPADSCAVEEPGGACAGLRPARHPASPDRAAPASSGCPRILVSAGPHVGTTGIRPAVPVRARHPPVTPLGATEPTGRDTRTRRAA